MSKKKRKNKISHETTLFAVGVTLFIAFVAIIIFSFIFIVNDIFPAIAPINTGGDSSIFFDLEGFEDLRL